MNPRQHIVIKQSPRTLNLAPLDLVLPTFLLKYLVALCPSELINFLEPRYFPIYEMGFTVLMCRGITMTRYHTLSVSV